MKSLIIILLLIVLAAVLWLTRPSEASFHSMIHSQSTHQSDTYLADCAYHNHFVFSTVTRKGKTIFVGVVAHWFDLRDVHEAAPDKQEVKVKVPATL